MKKQSRKFISLLSARKQPIRLNPFNDANWLNGAYRTFSRTLVCPLAQGEKNQLCKRFFSEFRRFSSLKVSSFDAKIKDVILKTAYDFSLTIGQAQKLVNILLKYHLCLYYSNLNPVWKKKEPWIGKLSPKLHVPIDSMVLYRLCQVAPRQCRGLVTAARYSSFKNGKRRWHYYAKVFHPRSSSAVKAKFAWSKIKDYEPYFKLQMLIRSLARKKKIAPMLYEMSYLWK
jgi:hypothetical protein